MTSIFYHVVLMIRHVCLLNEPTGQKREMHGTVAAVAKRNLKAGEKLDGKGGFTVWGKALPLPNSKEALPIGLAHNVILQRDVAAGTILQLDDVNLVNDSATSMYREAISI